MLRIEARCRCMAVAGLVLAAGCVSPAEVETENTLTVAALLPFTGERAGFGIDSERALLLAAEEVNAAGGLRGKRLRVVARDENFGVEAARALLDESGARILIGPEDPTLARQLVPEVKARSIVHLLPGGTSPTILDPRRKLWFRLSPSAEMAGCALANQIHASGIRKSVVLTAGDDYSTLFSFAVARQLSHLSESTVPSIPVPGGYNPSYADVITAFASFAPEAIVLMVPPKAAAAIAQEYFTAGQRGRFFFNPTLETDVFLENVSPGMLETMLGVSPALSPSTSGFPGRFASRFGVPPLPTAFRYYDAGALAALALQGPEGTEPASGDTLASHLRELARPDGTQVGWDSLPEGLARAAAGEDLDYQGLSGSLDFSDAGEVDLGAAELQLWSVRNNRIQQELRVPACLPPQIH